MIPCSTHLRIVGILLVLLAVAGCVPVTPEVQSSSLTETLLPPPTSTTPPEDEETPAAKATATDLPDPTAPPTLPPTLTPTILATATPTTQPLAAVVANDYGAAPEINSEVWLNTDQPLYLEDLRGKVVLVDFWTYG